jgi:flagellar basal body-associated protein FliL
MAAVMKQQQSSARKLWIRLLIAIVLLLVVLTVASNLFHWAWTGFQGQKLRDWINLLITPILVAVLPVVLGRFHDQEESSTEEQQQQAHFKQADSRSIDDSQQEAALETYQDHILELLLDKNLSGANLERAIYIQEQLSKARLRNATNQ